MGRLSAFSSLFAAAVAATTLAACGGGEDAKLLPGTTASQIDANLSQVEQLVSEEECIGAENSAAEIESEVEGLTGVDGKLKRALAEGAAKLNENVAAECEEASFEEEAPPTVEPNEEAESDGKPKHEKPKEGPEEADEGGEGPTLPPPSKGKGEEKGHSEEAPPAEPGEGPEPSSGGIGPGVPAEGD